MRASYSIETQAADHVTIRDLDSGGMSVTNDAEAVVADLVERGVLHVGQRLFYYDSEGCLDELLVTSEGGNASTIRFAGFGFGGLP